MHDVLTALDVVLRLEAKVDAVIADHEERLRRVEKSGIVLQGAWVTLGMVASFAAATAGLIIGALAYTGWGGE